MKADEVETRSRPAVRIIFLVRTMLKEYPEKVGCFRIAGTGGLRPADPRPRQGPEDRIDGKVIQLEIFFRGPLPVGDVRFVPYFP